MSGFGGFGTGSGTGGGFFTDKPPEQATGGFNVPTTTAVTTTTGLTFGTPAFGTTNTGLFGAQQQSTGLGTAFGAKPGQGFTFNTPATNATSQITFGSPATTTNAPTIGATTTAPGFNLTSTTTAAPTFGSFATTSASTFGAAFNAPKTTGITGFTVPAATTTAATSFNFGLTSTAATSATTAPLTFGLPTTAAATTVTTTTTSASTLTFNVSTSGAAPLATQSTGFTQPTTTSTLTFGVPKATKTVTFGTATTTFNAAATTTPSLGTGVFGIAKTTEATPGVTTTTTSSGLGGIDYKQTTPGLSGTGTLEPKQSKDHTLPDPILQTLNDFQNFTKQQKSLSVEISHGSSKPLKKVQEDTEAMESLLTMITSGLTRNAIAVDKLKTETAQGLHQAEMAQRNHETPPGLDYDNSAPADYFNDLVTKFETDTVRLRVQVEASEKHLRSLTQSSTISPQELTLAMRRLHETLIVLAARVQTLHTSVQSQKEQFKNLRRVYLKDDSNIFESETDQNVTKKETIYSLRSLTGPTPFSENPNTGPPLHVDGLAMLASSTGATIPATSTNQSCISQLQDTAGTSSVLAPNFFNSSQAMRLQKTELTKPPCNNKRNRR